MPKGIYPHTKPPWNKGTKGIVKPSPTSFKKGHLMDEKIRRKISKTMKDKKILNGFKKGDKGYWLGKHLSEATKEKISKFSKPFHNTLEQKEFMRQVRLKTICPKKDTSIELKLQGELSSRGIDYTKHIPVIGQPDIAFPDKKLAIFCNGDYWHNRPEVKERDLKVNEKLRNDGWLVLRYTEYEINSNVGGIVNEIEGVIFCNAIWTEKK